MARYFLDDIVDQALKALKNFPELADYEVNCFQPEMTGLSKDQIDRISKTGKSTLEIGLNMNKDPEGPDKAAVAKQIDHIYSEIQNIPGILPTGSRSSYSIARYDPLGSEYNPLGKSVILRFFADGVFYDQEDQDYYLPDNKTHDSDPVADQISDEINYLVKELESDYSGIQDESLDKDDMAEGKLPTADLEFTDPPFEIISDKGRYTVKGLISGIDIIVGDYEIIAKHGNPNTPNYMNMGAEEAADLYASGKYDNEYEDYDPTDFVSEIKKGILSDIKEYVNKIHIPGYTQKISGQDIVFERQGQLGDSDQQIRFPGYAGKFTDKIIDQMEAAIAEEDGIELSNISSENSIYPFQLDNADSLKKAIKDLADPHDTLSIFLIADHKEGADKKISRINNKILKIDGVERQIGISNESPDKDDAEVWLAYDINGTVGDEEMLKAIKRRFDAFNMPDEDDDAI